MIDKKRFLTLLDLPHEKYVKLFRNTEENMEENAHFMEPILKRLEDVGRVRERLDELLKLEIFDDLSKHNPYFDSEHDLESDKLYDIRCKFRVIQDSLEGISNILYKD
jgi:hypothetical protein